MLGNFLKIFHGFLVGGSSQTFVIFDFEVGEVFLRSKLFEIVNGEKRNRFTGIGNLKDRRYKFLHEIVQFDQTGPKVMDKVNDKSFNMTAVFILICHYH